MAVKKIEKKAEEDVEKEKTRFGKEVKKSIVTAIVAAFGLLTALAWKDVISEFVSNITGASPVQSLLVNALVVTVISVAAIMLVTWLSKKF